ncbi:MAG: Tetratricopeptide 2 repeat protein, partial [Acidobacteria bacterium]|nr:Tetratricopeptide 2 repeat protein [Acidobacteriota bacterium]
MRRLAASLFAILCAARICAADQDPAFQSLGHEVARAWADGDFPSLVSLGALAAESDRRGQLAFRSNRRCFGVDAIQVGAATIEGERATAIVAVAMQQTERATGYVFPREVRHLAITFSRSPAGGWRISSMASAESLFAKKLVAAKSESDGDALLDAQPELVTRELDRRLALEAYSLVGAASNIAAARRAVRLARRIVPETGDDAELAYLDAIEARCLHATARADSSLVLIQAAVMRARAENDADVLSLVLFTQGQLLTWTQHAGENNDAIRAVHEEAFLLVPRLENPGLTIGGYGFIALLKAYGGDWRSGVNDCLQALELARESGDTPSYAYLHLQLGWIYASEFDLERSIYYFQQALSEYRPRGKTINLVNVLLGLSRELVIAGRLREALAMNEEAWGIAQEIGAGELFATIQANRARIAMRERRWEEARQSLDEMACEGDRYHFNTPERWATSAELELLTGHYDASLTYAEDVIARAGGRQQIEYISAMTTAARAERGRKHPRAAELWLRDAIDALEQSRGGVAGPVRRRPFAMQPQADCYEELVDLLVHEGRYEEALRVAERAKARTLLDLLSNRPIEPRSPGREAEREKRRHRIEELTQEIRPATDPVRAAALHSELQAARIAFDELDVDKGEKASASVPSDSMITKAGVASMLVPDSAFVEFVAGPERTYLFVAGMDLMGRFRLRVRSIAIGREQLKRQVDAYAAMLATRDLRYGHRAASLEHLLFAGSGVEAYGTLCLVPDGPLWNLPFAALIEQGRHFVERHALFYAPSIAAYETMIASRARPADTRELLAFGNPRPAPGWMA